MQYTVDALRNPHSWESDVIGFVPFVGQHYDRGIDGARVLLLGESHYATPEEATRDLTLREYKDCEQERAPEVRQAWPIFFRRLDQIVTRDEAPTADVAAEAWSHVAFGNFVQKVVGTSPQARPDAEGWETGRRAFPALLAKLRPNVVLVLGSMAFEQTPGADGERIGELHVASSKVARSLWRIRHEGGHALMSWVYHPSWNRDSQQTRIAIFSELIRRAPQHE